MITLKRRLPPLKHRLWDPKAETMSREELEKLQLERLQATVRRVYERVPFYREKLDAAGIKPEDIRTLEDVQKLPFTCKDDMRAAYPYGLFAAPLKDIVRIHASSGTTGLSTVVGYTRRDLRNWSDLVARLLTAGGVTATMSSTSPSATACSREDSDCTRDRSESEQVSSPSPAATRSGRSV